MSRPALFLLVAGGLFLAGCAREPADATDSAEETPSSVTASVPELTPAVQDAASSQDTPPSDESADAPGVQPESAFVELGGNVEVNVPPAAPAVHPRSAPAEPEPESAAPPSLPEVALDEAAPSLTPVPIESGVVAIGPENTEIQFVGRHTDKQKDDRVGVFQEFSGRIVVDPEAQALKAISVEIQTDSLLTPIDRLTNHLKSPDFFEVREYPTASFRSTQITTESADPSQYLVVGELTLHGVRNRVNFPAAVGFVDDGLTLISEFMLERSEFGMNWGPDQVENEVMMTVRVGKKTEPPSAKSR